MKTVTMYERVTVYNIPDPLSKCGSRDYTNIGYYAYNRDAELIEEVTGNRPAYIRNEKREVVLKEAWRPNHTVEELRWELERNGYELILKEGPLPEWIEKIFEEKKREDEERYRREKEEIKRERRIENKEKREQERGIQRLF